MKLLLAICLTIFLTSGTWSAVCNPYGTCTACKDCSRCRYCSGKNNSATCSVCRDKKKPAIPAKLPNSPTR